RARAFRDELVGGRTGPCPPDPSQGVRIHRSTTAGKGQRDGEIAPGDADLHPERAGRHQPGGQRGRRTDSRGGLRGGHGSEVTSESLEVRQQIEKSLVAKISETLEPLLGAKGFRAGASVDYDLTSGEQQEETLDPSRSVMVSSQKTEDVTEHATTSGIPGTASNLPQQASSSAKGSNGTSRRTENVTYQTSRVIRHTKIPQGVIRRMSLAVLVDQSVHWEGEGANKHRVLVPPAPETLKIIKDLVAGIAGLDVKRGDQLIVETLPFESSLNSELPKSPKPVPVP